MNFVPVTVMLKLLPIVACLSVQSSAAESGVARYESNSAGNVAKGCNVTFSVPPNHWGCTDQADGNQLTDGEYVSSDKHMWRQKGAVGWIEKSPVIITLDLREEQTISAVSVRTAAGGADAKWPHGLLIFVSSNMQDWKFARDLVESADSDPPPEVYSRFKYSGDDLRMAGRYIAIVVINYPSIVLDEIEVRGGADNLRTSENAARVTTNLHEFVQEHMVGASLTQRLRADARRVAAAVDNSAFPPKRKRALRRELQIALHEGASRRHAAPHEFRTLIPQSAAHAKILAVYGSVLSSKLPPLSVSKGHRYAHVPFLTFPARASPQIPEVSLTMMGGETRHDAFSLTNATTAPMKVRLSLRPRPDSSMPVGVTMSQVVWTDTRELEPVAAALLPATTRASSHPSIRKESDWYVTIPAGLTQRMWLTVDSSGTPPGTYHADIALAALGTSQRKPRTTFNLSVQVRVSPVVMQRPRLSLGMWDYSDGQGHRGLTVNNLPSAIRLMLSHFVDTPWATADVLPRLKASDFDEHNNLRRPVDFAKLSEWIGRWPTVRNYFVFADVIANPMLAGAEVGSRDFGGRVGAWARALSNQIRLLGLEPHQLGLLLVDEPHTTQHDDTIAAWADAINTAAPELTLFENPAYKRPDKVQNQAALNGVDILCPKLSRFHLGEPEIHAYFEGRRQAGQKLWFYECEGPSRLLSPSRYFRLQAWHAFKHNAAGQAFWAFGDVRAESSWNEYSSRATSFTPVFVDRENVTNTVHWDAVREGMQDHETLAMLRDAIQHSRNFALKNNAARLLSMRVDSAASAATNYRWAKDGAEDDLDRVRLECLELLERFQIERDGG